MNSRRILIIEDNVDLAQSTRAVLTLHGFLVWIAATGHQGVWLGKQVNPDVVLCDIGLPGITGYEVAQAFRREASLRHTHLIAVTARGSDEDILRSRQVGFEHHLVKPVDPVHLVDVLNSYSPQD